MFNTKKNNTAEQGLSQASNTGKPSTFKMDKASMFYLDLTRYRYYIGQQGLL